MEKFRIMATTTFGLEAVAKREITDLGFEDITVLFLLLINFCKKDSIYIYSLYKVLLIIIG